MNPGAHDQSCRIDDACGLRVVQPAHRGDPAPCQTDVGLVPKPARSVDHSPIPYQRVELHGSSVVCRASISGRYSQPLPLDVRKRTPAGPSATLICNIPVRTASVEGT